MIPVYYEAIKSFVCDVYGNNVFAMQMGEVRNIREDVADELLVEGLIKPVNVLWN